MFLYPLENPKPNQWYGNWDQYHLNRFEENIANIGVKGHFTPHSLRMFDAGIDKQLIQEQTGHASTSVRAYKRKFSCLKQNVSAVLQGKSSSTSHVGDSMESSVPYKVAKVEKSDTASCYIANAHSDVNVNVQVDSVSKTVNITVRF